MLKGGRKDWYLSKILGIEGVAVCMGALNGPKSNITLTFVMPSYASVAQKTKKMPKLPLPT